MTYELDLAMEDITLLALVTGGNELHFGIAAWNALCQLSDSNVPAQDVMNRLRKIGITDVYVADEKIEAV